MENNEIRAKVNELESRVNGLEEEVKRGNKETQDKIERLEETMVNELKLNTETISKTYKQVLDYMMKNKKVNHDLWKYLIGGGGLVSLAYIIFELMNKLV